MAARREEPKVPEVIERFAKSLVVTAKAVTLYPPASRMPRETAAETVAILSEVLRDQLELKLTVTKAGLYYHEIPVGHDRPGYDAFARDLYNRRLADVRFHAGATAADVVAFLSVLKFTPEEIAISGGVEGRMWELGVATITVTEAKVSIVEGMSEAEAESSGYHIPKARAEIDEILASAYGGRPRDQLTIVRFMGDTSAVTDYLRQTYASSGEVPDTVAIGERFAELAEVAFGSGDESRHALIQSLAKALADLDPELARIMLTEEILPQARTNEPLAAVIRQLDVDSVCRMLVERAEEGDVSREGLARAIRNLAMISLADRTEVVAAAGAAMRGAGFGDNLVGDILEMASPSRLMVRERTAAAEEPERPADAIFKLMDLAPTPQDREADDPDVIVLREEASKGITDGDVIMALVSLVGMDSREQQFASTMAMLEDSLDLLIERGELEIAADSADALLAAAKNPALSPEQKNRLERALNRFTKPTDVRGMAHALRLYDPGTVEHQSARRLLDLLGAGAISPLLEQLADEPDMGVRKSLVDLLCQMAPNAISELGGHVGDARWYVARNVVNILGSTRSSASLPYLERAIRHPETRVRRETIRALSLINDRYAHGMLMGALDDEDPQNVQLAARYLGSCDIKSSASSLEAVAKGEGRGSRELGPRVEAIEALGRLGAASALPTLEMLAGRRALIGASKARELRAAAESAIACIRNPKGGAQ